MPRACSRPEAPVVDVAVVGAGPVGLAAALLLARWGLQVTVLEQQPGREIVGSRALCMQRDVLDVLDRIGCAEPLLREGVTWTVGRTYFRDQPLFEIRFPEAGASAFPPFVNIGQDRTEHHLETALGGAPGAALRYGCRATAVHERPPEADDHPIEVELETGAGRERLRARFVVGADGPHGAMRRMLGVSFDGRSFDDRFLICDIRARLGFERERRFFFDPEWNPGRQVLIHPQADSVWRIDWQVPSDYDLEEDRLSGGLDRRIRAIVGDAPYEIVWMTVYQFHQRLADRLVVGSAMLAGDAAHLMSPFGARGLNSGIQDAENLAWKIAYVTHGWSPRTLVDTYHLERHAAALENLRVTGRTMEFLVPQTPAQRRERERRLVAAVGNEDAPALVDSGRLAEPFWYTDSPLTTPPARPIRCDRGPDGARPVIPGVLCPDGECRRAGTPAVHRLRQLFGRGTVVLTTGCADTLVDALRGEPSPVEVYPLAELDPSGELARRLGSTIAPSAGGSAAIVRPDGHLAAWVPQEPATVLEALDRSLGRGA